MKRVAIGLAAGVLVATTGGAAMAQDYARDAYCRQYADQAAAPLRDQANSQTVGGTLLGAGLGAAVGAAVGGGRGAGIGAASGALLGTGAGAANAQNTAAAWQQQYNAYYYQCMSQGQPAPQPYYGAQPGYAPQPGYQQYQGYPR